MGESLATLGLVVDASGAKREIKLTADELKKLANGGKEAAEVMRNLGPKMTPPPTTAPAINRVSDAIKRMRDAAQQSGAAKFADDLRQLEERNNKAAMATQRLADSMKRMRQAAAQKEIIEGITALDPFQKAAMGAQKATIDFGKLREGMTSLASAAVGLPGPLGSIASNLGIMSAGAPLVVGVLAGVAALGFAWTKLTQKSRDAKEAFQKQLDVLRDLKREQDLGITGEAGASVKAGRDRLAVLGSTINANQRLIDGGQLMGQSLGFSMKMRDDAIKEYTELGLLVGAGEKKITELKKAEEERRADEADKLAEKEFDAWKRRFQERIDLLKREDSLARLLREASEQRERSATLSTLGVGVQSTLIDSQARADAAGRIGATKTPGSVFDSLAKFGDDAKRKLLQTLADLGVIQRVTKEEAQKAAAKSMAINAGIGLLTAHGGVGGNILAAGIQGGMTAGPWGAAIGAGSALVSTIINLGRSSAEAARRMQALRQSFDDFILAANVELGLPGAKEAQIKAQAHAQFADQREKLEAMYPKYFRNQSASVMAEYLKKLAELTAKEAELTKHRLDEAKAIDKLNSSMVNMVEGYKLQSTIFRNVNARGDRPNPFGGPRRGNDSSGSLTVNVTLGDGSVLARAVLTDFQRQAAAGNPDLEMFAS